MFLSKDNELITKGKELFHLGRWDEAKAYFRQALILSPNHFKSLKWLGATLRSLERLDEAAIIYRQLLELEPSDTLSLSHLIHIEQHLARWDDLTPCLNKIRQSSGLSPISPFASLAFPNMPPREQQQFARRYAKSILIPSPAPLHPVQPPARSQRIRLGYLSDSFSTSATASLIVQVLELHNREQFEVFIYSYTQTD